MIPRRESALRKLGTFSFGRNRTRSRRRPAFDRLETRELLSTFTVTNTNNAGDGSLRWAIERANAQPGGDLIKFNIPSRPPYSGVHTIELKSALPAITGRVTIDGYSQIGAKANTLGAGQGDNAIILIQIKAVAGAGFSGLVVTKGDGTVIEGLSIVGFSKEAGIALKGGRTTRVVGDFLGLQPNGDMPSARNGIGVAIEGAHNNVIGGLTSADRNLISGNLNQGIKITGNSNMVINDLVGTDNSGTGARPNGEGIVVANAKDNTIGGRTVAARNLVSGNTTNGIEISAGGPNQIVGNWIGTNFAGTSIDPNAQDGILLNAANGTIVSGNLISGNGKISSPYGGIAIGAGSGLTAKNNVVAGNVIGLDSNQSLSLSNIAFGIQLQNNANNNTIGGTAAADRNLISSNLGDGINDTVTNGQYSENFVWGNAIGTDSTGTSKLGNGGNGISVSGAGASLDIGALSQAPGNMIDDNFGSGVFVGNKGMALIANNLIGMSSGGVLSLGNMGSGVSLNGAFGANIQSNTISGNMLNGVDVANSPGSVRIESNTIGLNQYGNAAVPNGQDGVNVNGSNGVSIIGNVISGNGSKGGWGGVDVGAASASANTRIVGNSIGVNSGGTAAFGNQGFGVRVSNASNGTTIGGTTAGSANVISGNSTDGILLQGGSTVVLGNDIGLNRQQTAALPNGLNGVENHSNAATIGGTATGAGNVIAGNADNGVLAMDSSGSGVVIQGNTIGTTPSGTAGLGNVRYGVVVLTASGVTIGGTANGAGNTISGNQLAGMYIGIQCNNTAIQGNDVGTNPAGTSALPNLGNGITVESNLNQPSILNLTIGGTAAGAGNLISGNQNEGIALGGVSQSVIQGNLIGTSASGQSAIGNLGDGIGTIWSIGSVTIGGTIAGAGNTISGNGLSGIQAATGMLIQGNSIGTNQGGTAALGNAADGVFVSGASPTIGGTTAAAGNVISGNVKNGIEIVNPLASSAATTIGYNLVGTSSSGKTAVPNAVGIYDAGKSDQITSNVISGNTGAGLILNNASGANVSGNFIGLSADGQAALANALGVSISGTIQAANTLQGNYISGNTGDGVLIQTGLQKLVQNTIGPAVTGSAYVFNGGNGVEISGAAATGNIVGAPGQGNVIAFNHGAGVLLSGDSQTLIQGNIIGLDSTGTIKWPNSLQGVSLNAGSSNDTIGGTTQGAGNVISGNGDSGPGGGILVGGTTAGTLIQGNTIGLNANGTAALGNTAGVYIQGSAAGTTIGGTATGAGNTISGNQFDGVYITGAASGTLIQGDTIGLGSSGAAIDNYYDGIELKGGSGTTIGGTTSAARNVISGNGTFSHNGSGINVYGSSVVGTLIVGNDIGTDPTGTKAVGNYYAGISVQYATATIGAPGNGRNIISGNVGDGIYLNATDNVSIVNDLVGLNAAGNAAVANGAAGIEAYNAEGTTIGGLTGLSDFISGNTVDGILLDGATTATTIQGNTIGLAGGATQKLANGGAGINVTDTASSTTIGGTTLGTGNVLSGNTGSGINLASGTSSTLIQGNKIGTDVTTSNVLANGGDGITVAGSGATVGGTAAGATNVISGNLGNGITVNGASAANTLIQGNDIGTDLTGTLDRGNTLNGILVNQATGVTVGGTTTGADNLISGNDQNGIQVVNATGTLIQANEIGTDFTGTLSLANGKSGVQVTGSMQVTIGGAVAGGGNVISGNTLDGVQLSSAQSTLIAGNLIGTNLSGTAAVANGGQGVDLIGTTSQTTIGQVGFGNVISGNTGAGVLFTNQAQSLTMLANNIGVNRTGTGPVANAIGVELAGNTAVIGGGATGQGNVISGNLGNGVQVDGTARGIAVLGDQVVLNAGDGIAVNGASGVSIGGTGAGQGNLVSSNSGNGIHLASATGVSLVNNLIGTNAAGISDQGNGLNGILLGTSLNSTISGNVVSGNTGNGIELNTASVGNAITSNRIGVGVDGTTLLGNGGYGVFVQNDSSNNTIGGTSPGAGNIIAGNNTGVDVGNNPTTDNSQGDSILGNSIYANTGLGIDLGADGVTPNHNPQPTVGPNLLQNYPVLSTAMNSSSGGLTITGTLTSVANRTYRVEFFSQATGDPSGYGQGQTYLGYATVTTNGSGVATINATLAGVSLPLGQAITATATDPSGNTSEFSAWITVSPGPVA
ncbi:MAG: beta strand repeat-containing protein [Isosphaeraceae bacterium]